MKTPKFVCYIDYISGNNPSVDYWYMDAEDLFSAIMEAENAISPIAEKVYLCRIMKRVSVMHKVDGMIVYDAIMCTRGHDNWHVNDPDHDELRHFCGIDKNGDIKYLNTEKGLKLVYFIERSEFLME